MGRRLIADSAGFFSCDIEVHGPVLNDAIEREMAERILQCTLHAALAVLAQEDPWMDQFLDCVAEFMVRMRDEIARDGYC